MKTALVILAAGIGARYGGGVKQLETVGPHGELIIDYSIHDAIAAGFRKVVFIIRRDMEADFREVIGNRIQTLCQALDVEVAYAFQELEDLPAGITFSGCRKKPWGTGHALLACRDVLKEPFVVINADDYYGREPFVKIYDHLTQPRPPMSMAMAGFVLGNTLSENGSVTRGVCQVSPSGLLEQVTETRNVVLREGGAGVREADGSLRPLPEDAVVSMNMWGMGPEILPALEQGFRRFFATTAPDELERAEFLIPVFVDSLLKERKATVRVLPTSERWFGITYREDKPGVSRAFQALHDTGVYGVELFGDLPAT